MQNLAGYSNLSSKIVKITLLVWMGAVMFVYLLLFGPHVLWRILGHMGLNTILEPLRVWLQAFFTAGYKS